MIRTVSPKPFSQWLAMVTMMAALLPAGSLSATAEVPVEPAKNPFAGDALVLPASQPGLKAAPGVEQIQANCVLCHSLDYVSTQPPLTRAQWTAGVEKMRARFGAPLTTNQIPALVEYLSVNYGKP